MNNSQQTARVGLFFLLGLALIWVTFETLSGGKVFKDKGYTLIAGFETLKSLKPGDEVRMAGVKIGEVHQTQLSPAGRRAEAILRIDSNVHIKSDATATIAMQGLIGTNSISIDLGSAGAPDLPAGAEIRTRESADLNTVMTQIGDLGKKLESSLGNLGTALSGDGKNPGLVQKIDRLVTDNKEKVDATLTNLQQITDKVNKGEGTLGKLISDDSMLRDAQAIMKKADRALDGLDDTGPITAVGVVAKGLF
jgi:phospholipid/cholesterol/gamma-HCH transport system substrate-binding protein